MTGRSSERRIEACISFLDGQQLLDVEVTPTGTTRLQFDLGAVLEVKGSDCDDGDMWTLYKRRRGLALSVRAGGEHSHESASRAERWRKLPAAATQLNVRSP